MAGWLGVDVGGPRKGFDVALVNERRLLLVEGRLRRGDVVELIELEKPLAVGIDSPRSCAPTGQKAREAERRLNQAICRVRWTPDADRVRESSYYAWIVEGLALFGALAGSPADVIEVFPTASFTRWVGKRGQRTRSAWSREGLATLDLEGLPGRTNQDQRDAIAAAVTACQHTQGLTETIGEIVVPAIPRPRTLGGRPVRSP